MILKQTAVLVVSTIPGHIVHLCESIGIAYIPCLNGDLNETIAIVYQCHFRVSKSDCFSMHDVVLKIASLYFNMHL